VAFLVRPVDFVQQQRGGKPLWQQRRAGSCDKSPSLRAQPILARIQNRFGLDPFNDQ
jgi:hypothetical protein